MILGVVNKGKNDLNNLGIIWHLNYLPVGPLVMLDFTEIYYVFPAFELISMLFMFVSG